MKMAYLVVFVITIFLETSCVGPGGKAGSSAVEATGPKPSSVTLSKTSLKFVRADSEETEEEDGQGANAVDGDPETFWHTQWGSATPECPHEIVLELIHPATIQGFTYLPRQDTGINGTIKDYEFYVSQDGKNFGDPVAKGKFEAGQELKTVAFGPIECHYIKLRALSEINDGPWTSASEIGVVLK